jgi:hypothetical protein
MRDARKSIWDTHLKTEGRNQDQGRDQDQDTVNTEGEIRVRREGMGVKERQVEKGIGIKRENTKIAHWPLKLSWKMRIGLNVKDQKNTGKEAKIRSISQLKK